MEGVYYINQIEEINQEIYIEIHQLYKQLLPDVNFTINDLEMMIQKDNILVGAFVLYNKSLKYKTKLIGLATLNIQDNIIYKSIGQIQDVIVDKEFRKVGMAKGMIRKLLQIAKNKNCYKVGINSDPETIQYFMSTFQEFQKYNNSVISQEYSFLLSM